MKRNFFFLVLFLVPFAIPSDALAFTSECTGGTVTHSGGNTIHTFISNGTFDCTGTGGGSADYLVVAGGGGGAVVSAGGAGGGGSRSGFGVSQLHGEFPATAVSRYDRHNANRRCAQAKGLLDQGQFRRPVCP